MPEQGWPTLAEVHRAEAAVDRRVAGLVEELRAQRRELHQHRQNDRRELDQLDDDVDQLAGR